MCDRRPALQLISSAAEEKYKSKQWKIQIQGHANTYNAAESEYELQIYAPWSERVSPQNYNIRWRRLLYCAKNHPNPLKCRYWMMERSNLLQFWTDFCVKLMVDFYVLLVRDFYVKLMVLIYNPDHWLASVASFFQSHTDLYILFGRGCPQFQSSAMFETFSAIDQISPIGNILHFSL